MDEKPNKATETTLFDRPAKSHRGVLRQIAIGTVASSMTLVAVVAHSEWWLSRAFAGEGYAFDWNRVGAMGLKGICLGALFSSILALALPKWRRE
jgi:hypothetical protein